MRRPRATPAEVSSGKLTRDLELSPEQVQTIRASFASAMLGVPKFDRAEAEEHMRAFAAAFARDTFDAKLLVTGGGALDGHMATWGMTRTVQFYQAALAVLTPEQRTKLADRIRHHANYQHNEMPS